MWRNKQQKAKKSWGIYLRRSSSIKRQKQNKTNNKNKQKKKQSNSEENKKEMEGKYSTRGGLKATGRLRGNEESHFQEIKTTI